jgi:antitoxin CcdA
MTLAEFLQREGLTLMAFGQKLGVSHTTVRRWALGEAAPRDRSMFERISAATGGAVTAADFFPVGSSADIRGFSEAQMALEEQALSSSHAEATALGLDADAIAENALREAIRAEKARRWLEENREAIEAHNRWVDEHGLPLAEYRMF